ncbi:MAG TPA: hypothetical protein VFC78_18470 [Tepidisphaeraceae bacterium]|nr:hypothetical protein [Tepidisphaeraceae bacterium]
MGEIERIPLLSHAFQGGRFADHGIPVDVVEELVRYRQVLLETSNELWRRRHPCGEFPTSNFAESLILNFCECRCNHVTVRLERRLPIGTFPSLPQPDEIDDSVALIAETIEAVNFNRPLPAAFPRQFLSLFRDYGKSLLEDEWIEQTPAKWGHSVRYDALTRNRIQHCPGTDDQVADRVTPIWQEFASILASAPPDEISRLPHDSAVHHDRYISGKRI